MPLCRPSALRRWRLNIPPTHQIRLWSDRGDRRDKWQPQKPEKPEREIKDDREIPSTLLSRTFNFGETTPRRPKPSTLTDAERQTVANLLQTVHINPSTARNIQDPASLVTRLPEDLRQEGSNFTLRLEWAKYLSHQKEGAPGEVSGEIETEENKKFRESQEIEFERIALLLQNAETDQQVWSVMQAEIFLRMKNISNTVKSLNQDTEKKEKKKGRKPEKKKALIESDKMLTANYSKLLIAASQYMRAYFPSSSLLFAILPEIRRIGIHSYTLGTSTLLFNEIIKGTWSTYNDFKPVAQLLEEMVQNEISFDWETHDIMEHITKIGRKAQDDPVKIVSLVANRPEYKDSINGAEKWRDYIHERLESDHLRVAKEFMNKMEASEIKQGETTSIATSPTV
jgi:hypothetical protein